MLILYRWGWVSRTQDRDHAGLRTPRWRGITTLHEARAAGCQVALASDNTRDQFYGYGDLDMLEVFTQVNRHLEAEVSVCWVHGMPLVGKQAEDMIPTLMIVITSQ